MSSTENREERRGEVAEYEPNPEERGKWLSALLALLGLWLIVQVFLFDITASQFWNDVAVGVVLLAVGGYNYIRQADEQLASTAAAIIAALVGLWLIATPFVIGADAGATETVNDLAFWNDIVVGLLALALGAYSAYTSRNRRTDVRRTMT